MKDQETVENFISLRAQGRSFARIAQELNVCKQTLINWSHKFQFQIRNLRAIELEALQHQWIDSQEARVRALGEQLHRAQAELAKRDLADVPTGRLFSLVDSLRQQILRETGGMQFSTPLNEIPSEERCEQAQDGDPDDLMKLRRLSHGLNRRLNRYTTRMLHGRRPRPPNDLAIAVRALRGAIRSHKRLIKLAPELFDFAAIDRREREEEAQRHFESEVQAALARVYGIAPLANEKPV